jgi:hypothetical protein
MVCTREIVHTMTNEVQVVHRACERKQEVLSHRVLHADETRMALLNRHVTDLVDGGGCTRRWPCLPPRAAALQALAPR